MIFHWFVTEPTWKIRLDIDFGKFRVATRVRLRDASIDHCRSLSFLLEDFHNGTVIEF